MENKRKGYCAPSVEIVCLTGPDIITTSPTELETTAPDQDGQ